MTTEAMTVGNDKVVFIHYTLSDATGQVIDSTLGDEPLAYLHGHANLIPGLERARANRPVAHHPAWNQSPAPLHRSGCNE